MLSNGGENKSANLIIFRQKTQQCRIIQVSMTAWYVSSNYNRTVASYIEIENILSIEN